MDTGNHQKANPSVYLGVRPDCPCCGGRDFRKGKTMSRAKSHRYTLKHLKAKPKRKDHR